MNQGVHARTTAGMRGALVLLWLTPALWAVNYIVARKAPGVIEPHVLAAGRWALAALVLTVVAHRELWHHRRQVLASWREHLILGALGMMICGAWVYLGARTTSAMNIALIYAASPVLIALGAVIWLRERFSLRQAAGVVLALSGVIHVIVQGRWTALATVHWVPGDAWIVACMVSWAAYALLLKRWSSPLSATARLAVTAWGGVLTLLPGVGWELAGAAPGMRWSAEALALVVSAALIPGVGAYWAYSHVQRVLGASRVAATLYMGPLWGALAAWGVLGESLGWHHAAGAALIIPGIALVTRQPR